MCPPRTNVGPAMRVPRLYRPESRKYTQELPAPLGALLATECSQIPLSPQNETRWSFLPNIIDWGVNMDCRKSAMIYRLRLRLEILPRLLSRPSAGYLGNSCVRHHQETR